MRTLKTIFILLVLAAIPASVFPQKNIPQRMQERLRARQAMKVQADSLALAKGLAVRVERPDGTTYEIQRFENGIPRYYITDNLTSAKTISSNKVWSGGGYGYSLSGNGVLLGEWDGGNVLTTHQEFGGRATSPDPAGLNYHSTHVAGTMIASGVIGNARGMSGQASLISHDWSNDLAEMISEAGVGLKVSNHSYGQITGWRYDYYGDAKWVWFGDSTISETEDFSFGFYDIQAEDWDNTAYLFPNYLIVKSAGNDRNEGPSGAVSHWFFKNGVKTSSTKARSKDGNSGYDCVASGGVGKNVLTVGAIEDISGGYVSPGGVIMSSFSCWGPTDDGRIKPDIVANGVGLYSTLETSNNAYGSLSGTSMATPSVTGAIGLILEHQKNLHGSTPLRSSTVKALIINSADETGSTTGPDYIFGWGIMNTLKAVQLMTLDTVDGAGSHVREINLPQGTTAQFDISCDGTLPLKATIAWVDPAGNPPAASLDPPTQMLVNDLDLRIIKKKDLTTYQPWILNPASPATAATTGDNIRDNVEQVYVASPERAEYTVRVTHKGATLSGGAQNFSVVISGNVKSIGPIVYTTPDTVEVSLIPGGVKTDSIRLANYGDTVYTYSVVRDTTLSWLTVAETGGTVADLDSEYYHYTFNAASLPQWSTFTTNVTLTGTASPIVMPFTLHTLGPKIATTPAYVAVDVDSGATGTDSVVIRNTGYTPLSYVIRGPGGSFPVWMTLNDTDGTIAPGDTAIAIMTVNASPQPVGDYTTMITIASNDSSTGDITTQVDLHVGTRSAFDVNVRARWNIVSLPVRPFTYYKAGLFPTAVSPAYAFNGSTYDQKDTLSSGAGYWMKFPSAQLVTVDGYTFTADTLPLVAGWNIVGSISEPIPSASASTTPADILTSGFFEYTTGFAVADTLRPGRGYFVQSSQDGSLLLGAGPAALPKQAAVSPLAGLNTITIEDAAKNAQTLYFGDSKSGGRGVLAMMPPQPPVGSFDARFTSGALAEAIDPASEEREFSIRVASATEPVTVRWTVQKSDRRRYTLSDRTGTSYDLTRSGSVTLGAVRTLTLSYSDPVLPSAYALEQNYPNPFNPTTKIAFELPAAGFVTLKVYNILGNEVASLVNSLQDAGRHEVMFDASSLPSGVYIFKMQSDRFSQIKKMMLMR